MSILRDTMLTILFLLCFETASVCMPHPCSLQNSQIKCENHTSPECFWNREIKNCESVDVFHGCASFDRYLCSRVAADCIWSESEGYCRDR